MCEHGEQSRGLCETRRSSGQNPAQSPCQSLPLHAQDSGTRAIHLHCRRMDLVLAHIRGSSTGRTPCFHFAQALVGLQRSGGTCQSPCYLVGSVILARSSASPAIGASQRILAAYPSAQGEELSFRDNRGSCSTTKATTPSSGCSATPLSSRAAPEDAGTLEGGFAEHRAFVSMGLRAGSLSTGR